MGWSLFFKLVNPFLASIDDVILDFERSEIRLLSFCISGGSPRGDSTRLSSTFYFLVFVSPGKPLISISSSSPMEAIISAREFFFFSYLYPICLSLRVTVFSLFYFGDTLISTDGEIIFFALLWSSLSLLLFKILFMLFLGSTYSGFKLSIFPSFFTLLFDLFLTSFTFSLTATLC